MAGSRSALIVATYQHDDPRLTRLRAPAQDAEALAEILSDPDIGGFDVTTAVNRRWHELNLAVAAFFHDRHPDDLLLLHFSCHGLKDDSGELYFAASDTRLDLLEATSVASSFVNRVMDRSRAGKVLLLLDCCYAGAFARAGSHRAAGAVDVGDRLGGRGRVVITASSALEYAFEGQELTTVDESPSVFTGTLVRGLRSGEADRDQDGWVSLDELYGYVYDEVRRITPHQTPKKWAFDMEGDVYVARRGGPVTVPSELPTEVRQSMTSLLTWERESAVAPLRDLLVGSHPGRALGARMALEEMAAHDDSDRVKAAARAALASAPGAAVDVTEPGPPVPGPNEPRPIEPEPPEPEPPEPGPNEPRPIEPGPIEPEVSGRTRRPRWLVPVVASVALVLVVSAVWAWSRRPSGASGVDQPVALPRSLMVTGGAAGLRAFDQARATPVGTVPGTSNARRPAISPDRRWIAYLGGDGLRVVRPDGTDNHALLTVSATRTCPSTTSVAWSPDGRQVAFVCLDQSSAQHSKGLYTYDLAHAALQQVLPAQPHGPLGTLTIFGPPTWVANTHLLFDAENSAGERSLWRVSVKPGSTPERWVRPVPGMSDEFPSWSSDGLLFHRCAIPGHAPCDIMLRTRSGDVATLVPHPDTTTPHYKLGDATWGPAAGQVAWTRWYDGARTVLQRGVLSGSTTVKADPSWHPEVPGANVSSAWGTPRPGQ